MPNENLFDDGPQTERAMPEGGDGDASSGGDDQTFVVNKSAYPEAKPGDTFTMRVVQVHDDEMECSVEKEGDSEEAGEGEAPEPAMMPSGGGQTDGMMD